MNWIESRHAGWPCASRDGGDWGFNPGKKQADGTVSDAGLTRPSLRGEGTWGQV